MTIYTFDFVNFVNLNKGIITFTRGAQSESAIIVSEEEFAQFAVAVNIGSVSNPRIAAQVQGTQLFSYTEFQFSAKIVIAFQIFVTGQVAMTVNDSYDADTLNLSTKDKLKLIRFILASWKKLLTTLPSGFELTSTPYNVDYKGLERFSLYVKLGWIPTGNNLDLYYIV